MNGGAPAPANPRGRGPPPQPRRNMGVQFVRGGGGPLILANYVRLAVLR